MRQRTNHFINNKPAPAGKTAMLGDILRPQLRELMGSKALGAARLINDWATIVPQNIAKGSKPQQIQFTTKDRVHGTLILQADSGLATELTFTKVQLIERINRYFGYALIKDIRVLQGHFSSTASHEQPQLKTEKPKFNKTRYHSAFETYHSVKEPKLREALARLAASLEDEQQTKEE